MMHPEETLPGHWKRWVEHRARGHVRLGAHDFPHGEVRLEFEDGSTAPFRYAFAVADVARSELAVFTEHCGYHVFALAGTRCEPAPGHVSTS